MIVLINLWYMQEDVLCPNFRNNNMDKYTRVRCNTRIQFKKATHDLQGKIDNS